MGDRGHSRHGPKRRGLLCPFCGELRPRLIQCDLSRGLLLYRYQVASSPIQPLATIDMGRKLGLRPLFGEEAGSPSNTKSPGLRPTSVPSAILIHPFGYNNIGRKLGEGFAPFLGRGAGSPSNTTSPGPRPTSIPVAS